MVYGRNSQHPRVSVDSYRKALKRIAVVFFRFAYAICCLTLWAEAQDRGSLEWVKNSHIDFVGQELAALQHLESISQPVLQGCRSSFDWPESFPNRLTVLLTETPEPRVTKGQSGIVRVELPRTASEDSQAHWLAKGLLTQFGLFQGVETPPPTWLIQAIRIRGILYYNPQYSTLLRRELRELNVPAISECLEASLGSFHVGWSHLVLQFLESGGMEKSELQLRLVQYWKNGYDWRQLGVFFDKRYPSLNPAELDLLWKTFTAETLASDGGICLSEQASLEELERISRLEILVSGDPEVLPMDVWYLHRADPAAVQDFARKHGELEALAVSVHPYYFNACHSLDQVLLAIETDNLEAFRDSVKQYTQDILDAQQLGFETDRLMERLCP